MKCKIKGTYQYRPARVAALCLAVLLVVLCLCTGCGNTTRTDPSEDGVLRVVCTTFPGWEFCRAVTGIQSNDAGKDGVEVLSSASRGRISTAMSPAPPTSDGSPRRMCSSMWGAPRMPGWRMR